MSALGSRFGSFATSTLPNTSGPLQDKTFVLRLRQARNFGQKGTRGAAMNTRRRKEARIDLRRRAGQAFLIFSPLAGERVAIAAREVCSSPTDNARGLRKAKLRQQRRAGLASLILSHVSFLMLVNDCVGRPRPGVQIAKAAITSNYIRNAFFDRTVLAVPVSIFSDAIDCAPGGVAVSSAGRSSEPCCRHNNNQTNYQLRKGFCHGFCHDDALSISRVFFEPTPQRKNKSRTTPFKSKGQGN